ncbi:hypothetical protein AArcS_1699 [Natranaeroarchaeum sulfidigenes]|uniref:Uncharacterized protein n=1 Tax=Natranaeroarchaeum sulfidigenes TaxID=2784880 RepID=A0A897MVE2_9EURY|nr:hypothetical protein AArcS_1699 [Natranaeroarchaeum sulfidigenes]
MEANGFGGTVLTEIPASDSNQHAKIADSDLRAVHDQHTAEARITDCQFEEFVDCHADASDVQISLTMDRAVVTTRDGHAYWSWGESTGSGTATYRWQEVLDVFDQLSSVESTPRFAWGDDETAAMIFHADSWYVIGYATSVQGTPSETARCHEESGTAKRHCRECGSQLERDPETGNWTCQSPKCGFRAIALE